MVVMEPRTVDEHLGVQLMTARLGSLPASLFAAVALVLASVGLYGAVSHAVSRRSRERGVRMSSGAGPGNVVRQVVQGGWAWSAWGVLWEYSDGVPGPRRRKPERVPYPEAG